MVTKRYKNQSEIVSNLESINWDFANNCSTRSIHNLHPYPAKFIPEIPMNLIRALGVPEDTVVCDPFCGSGTTLKTAQELGIPSIGIDLNPIACMISKIKTTKLPRNFIFVAENIVNRLKHKSVVSAEIDIPNVDHWFLPDIKFALHQIVQEIKLEVDPLMRLHLEFCLSANLVKISNQDSDTRYAAIKKNVNICDVYNAFLKTALHLHKVKNISGYPRAKAKVVKKDILKFNSTDLSQKIGLVVTSPPYPNAYEYWLYHKYRMFWLGHDPYSVKLNEIGARSHYFKKNPQSELNFMDQMIATFQNLAPNLANNAFLAFVVGDSIIHGREINNSQIIKEAAKKVGISHIKTLVRNIRLSKKSFNLNYGRIKSEKIVIMRMK